MENSKGSTEWVEEFQKRLIANGVVYLNTDLAVVGKEKMVNLISMLRLKGTINSTKF
jgi:hypothetical protein